MLILHPITGWFPGVSTLILKRNFTKDEDQKSYLEIVLLISKIREKTLWVVDRHWAVESKVICFIYIHLFSFMIVLQNIKN